jgi:hypothetical protein
METNLCRKDSVELATCKHIDWYSEGETRVVRVNGVEVRIRFVGRKGRRGRILVEAPAGAVFSLESIVEPRIGLR